MATPSVVFFLWNSELTKTLSLARVTLAARVESVSPWTESGEGISLEEILGKISRRVIGSRQQTNVQGKTFLWTERMVSWLRAFRGPGQPFWAWDQITPSVDKGGREEKKGWKARGQLCLNSFMIWGLAFPLGHLARCF